ncbi:MAG TPA: cytochrome P450 [Candidatus Binataceae bacterium]|nr:cytochrome P450 [Candidatus Binataceae bacterium]
MAHETLSEIAQPPAKPHLGNLLDIDREGPVQGFARLPQKYGPIYQLVLRGLRLIVVSGHQLVAKLCDEKRFDKSVAGAPVAKHDVREANGYC